MVVCSIEGEGWPRLRLGEGDDEVMSLVVTRAMRWNASGRDA